MRILKGKDFARFCRKEGITDKSLCEAVEEIHSGIIDADLGGGVFKQRVKRRGSGKSGGYRVLLLLRIGEIALLIHGFAKKDKANISLEELKQFRLVAKTMLTSQPHIDNAVSNGHLIEVKCDG